MITLDILEQRLLPSPYFDACLVCLFSIIINPIFICTIKTLRVSIKSINRFGESYTGKWQSQTNKINQSIINKIYKHIYIPFFPLHTYLHLYIIRKTIMINRCCEKDTAL